ncbi:hypothetical protein QW131_30905 [Roseibium salinum]|nr:hypothetical protein [Roseibium salinum]
MPPSGPSPDSQLHGQAVQDGGVVDEFQRHLHPGIFSVELVGDRLQLGAADAGVAAEDLDFLGVGHSHRTADHDRGHADRL